MAVGTLAVYPLVPAKGGQIEVSRSGENAVRNEEHTQRTTELAESRARHWSSTQHAGELHLDVITTYKLGVVHNIHTSEVSRTNMHGAHVNVRALLYTNG